MSSPVDATAPLPFTQRHPLPGSVAQTKLHVADTRSAPARLATAVGVFQGEPEPRLVPQQRTEPSLIRAQPAPGPSEICTAVAPEDVCGEAPRLQPPSARHRTGKMAAR